MHKLIYIAASTVCAVSIISSVCAGDGFEERKIGTPTKEISIENIILTKPSTPPKSLGDAMGERAYENFARQLEAANAKKEIFIEQIARDKERSNSLVEALNAVSASALPDGFSIVLPTGVKTTVTVGENGERIVVQESPPVSPFKTLRKQNVDQLGTIVRTESGTLISAEA